MMINVVKPKVLQSGDVIGIVGTSFPFPVPPDESNQYFLEYKKGVHELESLGFKTKEGKNLRKVKWWAAGTPEQRASDINDMFADPNVKAIIVHEGGQSAVAVLVHLDYELIRRKPKPFIGFSDVTNLHLALFTQAHLVGFQGPLLTYSLGQMWHKYLSDKEEVGKQLFKRVLTSTQPLGQIAPLSKWETWRGGMTSGQLFGGNLSYLAGLTGTKYFPRLKDLRGSILFWECDNTGAYNIEKWLYQLKYSGLFDVISGMVVGKLPDIQGMGWEGFEEPVPKEITLTVLKDTSFPIIGEMDFGHKTVAVPMPIGLPAKMDADTLTFEILEPAVS